jgi:signal transduction histidine kinase/phage shock protein PspC (stress-responsive transcriptional regulator)
MAAMWVVCDHLCRSGAPRGGSGRKETALKTNREPGPPVEGSATPTTPPHEHEDRRPPFVRSRRDRVIAGVAGGLAERLGVDSVLIRLGFVVLSLAGGIGIAIYLVLFAISQEEGDAPERPRRGGGRQRTIATILVLAGALLVFRSLGLWFGDDLVWPVAIAAFGSAIIWVRADRAGRAWKPAFPRRASSNGDGPSLSSISPVRLLIGAVLVAGGTAAFLAANISRGAIGTVVVAAAVTLSGLALIIGPWIMRLARQLSEERRERIRAEERQDVAAHLHDSVLQTLALIQRSEDPARMAALARVQERELRSWLYRPQGPQRGDLLSTAVDALAERIELAHRIQVETVVVGDCPLDDGLQAVMDACGEALTNAAKHSGAPRVSLYVEVAPDAVTAYVRDQGKGFDPEAVPEDRRGIADSIRGRLQRHGGTVEVVSSPGNGTEVRLTLPRGAE